MWVTERKRERERKREKAKATEMGKGNRTSVLSISASLPIALRSLVFAAVAIHENKSLGACGVREESGWGTEEREERDEWEREREMLLCPPSHMVLLYIILKFI